MAKHQMKSFHFDLGNSSVGPIGMCAQIQARTKADAVQRLKDLLPEELMAKRHLIDSDSADVEYINIYFNPIVITAMDIDDEEAIDEED